MVFGEVQALTILLTALQKNKATQNLAPMSETVVPTVHLLT